MSNVMEELARAVAASWACSTKLPGLSPALLRLVPHLKYASVAVCNPSQSPQGWSLVGAGNLAEAESSQLELLLLDPQRSAAGLALRAGKLVQGRLLNGTQQFSLQLGDVARLVEAAPSARFMLCLPFAPVGGGSNDSGGTGAAVASSAAGVPWHLSTLQGALLLGLEEQLSGRRLAALVALLRHLPKALARAAAATDILETLDYMTGAMPYQCPCCLEEDGEEDGDEPGSPCRDEQDPPPDRSSPPSQLLLVLAARASAAAADECRAGQQAQLAPVAAGRGKGAAAAAAAAAGLTCVPSCSGSPQTSGAFAARSSQAGGAQGPALPVAGKGKCIEGELSHEGQAAAAAELRRRGKAKTPRSRLSRFPVASDTRHPVWMTFQDPLLEHEFLHWHGIQHIKIDRMFTMLLVVALGIVGFCHPFRLVERNPWGLLLGFALATPLVTAVLGGQAYTARREGLIVVMRLMLVAFINLVSIPSYQAFVPPESLAKAATFWMLTGAESLLITALGLQVRFRLQLPLQLACMAIAAWHLPTMCSACYPGQPAMLCQAHSVRLLAGAGVVLPAAVLRFVESKSRAAFLHEVRAAAA